MLDAELCEVTAGQLGWTQATTYRYVCSDIAHGSKDDRIGFSLQHPSMSGGTHSAVFLSRGGPAQAMSRPLRVAALPSPARQRARIWELNESVHCSIIGTCLTTAELRRVMGKVVRADVSGFSDHDLHSEAVGLCNHRNLAAKLLQKTLDQRHDTVIRRFGKLHGEASVLTA